MPAMVPVERPWWLDKVEEPVDVDTPVAAAPDVAAVLVDSVPEGGGEMSNAGEKLTLLEFESSVILNLYCWVVWMSEGMRRVALPLFGSTAIRREACQHCIEKKQRTKKISFALTSKCNDAASARSWNQLNGDCTAVDLSVVFHIISIETFADRGDGFVHSMVVG